MSLGAFVSVNTDKLLIRVEGGECLGGIWDKVQCSGGVGTGAVGVGKWWGLERSLRSGTSWGLELGKHCSVLFTYSTVTDMISSWYYKLSQNGRVLGI